MDKKRFIETWENSSREASKRQKVILTNDVKEQLRKAEYEVKYLSQQVSFGSWKLDDDELKILAKDFVVQTFLDMITITKEQ